MAGSKAARAAHTSGAKRPFGRTRGVERKPAHSLTEIWRAAPSPACTVAGRRDAGAILAGASLSCATGSPMSTSSSAAVGCTAHVASHCALVRPAFTATAAELNHLRRIRAGDVNAEHAIGLRRRRRASSRCAARCRRGCASSGGSSLRRFAQLVALLARLLFSEPTAPTGGRENTALATSA